MFKRTARAVLPAVVLIFLMLASSCGIGANAADGISAYKAGGSNAAYAAGGSDAAHAANAADDSRLNKVTISMSGANRYKSIRLIPIIYNYSQSSLCDLLIKDAAGANVPYFIHTVSWSTSRETAAYQLQLLDSYKKNDDFYYDYGMASDSNDDVVANGIYFATDARNFVKSVDIYGSHDDIHWEFVQSDKLFSIDTHSKLKIDFSKPQKFTHYRLRLPNNLEMVNLGAASLVYSVDTTDEIYFVDALKPAFRVESADKQTSIIIDGLKNLRLCDVEINSDSMFKRMAYAQGGASKEIYDLALNGEAYSDTRIPLNRYIPDDDAFVIRISDGDDKPIAVSGITVRYYADELVFEGGAAGETYMLEFGDESVAAAPVYDIARYKDEILKGPIDKLAIGQIAYTPAAPRAGSWLDMNYRLIFNILIVIIALLLGFVILTKLRQK